MEGTATRRQLVAFLLVFCLALDGAEAGRALVRRQVPCDEVYVAKEGETLQTIAVKCDAPFVLDDNPQIQDDNDVGPGTVLIIRPWP
ncbi:hypothetical protein Taro_003444 [Colocasia esculenta]|uniref:LysM domain-containing protein n=1 Tax=Colocasia esculenta TaxID=4460 RepID=A0A843TP45_COLES|nr:hypothetical protein [Colocasia esculenta]